MVHVLRKVGVIGLRTDLNQILQVSPALLSSNAWTCGFIQHQKHEIKRHELLHACKRRLSFLNESPTQSLLYTGLFGVDQLPSFASSRRHLSYSKEIRNIKNNLQIKLHNNHGGGYIACNQIISERQYHSLNKKRNKSEREKFLIRINQNPRHTWRCRNLSLTPKGILDASPSVLQPYLRLVRFDKPIGTWLLYWPCTWSIGLAATAGHFPDPWLLALFGLGSFFMRGAGCIINDMWDRDFDKKVERTKLRPLASGELSMFQGLVCLGGMLSVSLGILLQLNWYSVYLGAASMGLVIMYPLAKRFTYWPQALLGVTLNWGVLLAWSAINGCVQLPVIPLYVACVFYTMIYDSIYSHQDKYDDMLIGVKSTALKFGDDTKKWLTGFGAIMVSGLVTTGVMMEQTWPYFAGVALTGSHLAHQIYTVDLNNADDCAKKFRSNTQLGLVMFWGIVIGTLLKEKKNKEKEETETS